jgi:hypothetical protein
VLKTQRVFCVCHELPLVPENLFDYAIGLGDYWPKRGAHVSVLDPFWDRMRPLAYGAAGNYAIPRAMETEVPPTELTAVFSRRKIVVRNSIGRESIKHPWYRQISPTVASLLSVEEVRPRDGFDFLIGRPMELPMGVIQQYARAHHPIDLFEYLSIAVQTDVMTPAEVREFSLNKVFIPGGCELGIYPTAWISATLRKLEVLGRDFIARCGERIRNYDSYQVRAVGFLAVHSAHRRRDYA